MFIPLSLPPGVWRNGTEYESKGRYFDSNLVRWYDGQLRPWGGWSAFSTTQLGAPPVRGMLNWTATNGDFWMLMGTPTKVYVSDFNGDINDITPAGLTAGNADASNSAGYGAGPYGAGPYGVSSGSTTTITRATVWTMDTLEQTPIICNADDGKLYQWDLNTAHVMTALSGAPTSNKAVFVTEEGFIIVIGAGGDPRAIQWPDQGTTSVWTPTQANAARSEELEGSGQGMCGVATAYGSLIWTTTEVHLLEFIGQPDIYSLTMLGTKCGIVSQAAFAVTEDFACWMGPNGFWQYNGAISAIESDVADYVFSNINQVQISKVWTLHNGQFGEVTWFYPSASSTEIDSYVTYNYREGHWAIGKLARTCGLEAGILPSPVMVDATGNIWAHETGFTYTGAAAPFAETGPLEYDETFMGPTLQGYHPGDRVCDIINAIPDNKTIGDVQITIYSRFYPLEPQRTSGPYTLADPTTFRVSGREHRVRFTGASASDWRVGTFRLDIRPGGER